MLVVGPNTAGKSNFIESVYLLSTGKSFKAQSDTEMVSFGHEMGRVKAQITDGKEDKNEIEVLVTTGEVGGQRTQFKRFFINKVAKRRLDFVGLLPSVLFSPEDLEIIAGSPSLRRSFLDNVLEQTDREYRHSLLTYVKSLRQRNALLELAKGSGIRNVEQFRYWDNLVITNGQTITQKRSDFIEHINSQTKDIFEFEINYDKSIISKERLLQYDRAELASGVTLVGPHRDDIILLSKKDKRALKSFGSRGQQRLAVLQLKFLELNYIKEQLSQSPLLLLDDIFSELDEGHIKLILGIKENQQTIITTTHKEFVPTEILKTMEVVELKNGKI